MEYSNKSFKELEKDYYKKHSELVEEFWTSKDKREELYKKLRHGESLTPEEDRWEKIACSYGDDLTRLFRELGKPKYPNRRYRKELEDKLDEMDTLLEHSSMKIYNKWFKII